MNRATKAVKTAGLILTMQSLENAIAQLYDVFSRYPSNARMQHCEHCISAREVQELAARPLRSLTAEQAGPYSWDAITLWGSVDDLKHFLPRLMELVVIDADFLTDVEILFSKLRHGNWLDWPASEVAAVREYLHAFWLKALTGDDPATRPDSTLCAIGQAESTLKPYLEVWLASESLSAAQRLAEFIDENLPSMLKKSKLGNAFWEDREPQAKEVRDWLRSLAVRRKLEDMAMANSESPLAEVLMATADRLQVFDTRLGDA